MGGVEKRMGGNGTNITLMFEILEMYKNNKKIKTLRKCDRCRCIHINLRPSSLLITTQHREPLRLGCGTKIGKEPLWCIAVSILGC